MKLLILIVMIYQYLEIKIQGNTTNGIEITVDENDVLELTDNKDERTLNVDKKVF